MSTDDESTRTIKVDYLARVEGEGALTLTYRDGQVADVQLRIFEPPRFFEALLVGRSCLEAPDVTARICGICPVAYQMSACAAVESALGVQLPDALIDLRRLLYCGEWIESHALHMVMLHAPDFLGVDDAMGVARTHRQQVLDGLAVKKAGNAIVQTLGGREIHPINVKVGGFWGMPRRSEFEALRDQLAACREAAEGLVRWVAGFPFPELHIDVPFVALTPGDRYPFMGTAIGISTGQCIEVAQWNDVFEEEHVARSTALHARIKGQGAYLCGPLARWELAFDQLPSGLRDLADELGARPPIRNPFRSIVVRGFEVLFAIDTAISILDGLGTLPEPSVTVEMRAGVGWGATEAPRGTLVHRYELDDAGLIREANIVPPTAQNQLAIEADLRAIAAEIEPLDDETAARRAEATIRNYDPCISCATHFLTFDRVRL